MATNRQVQGSFLAPIRIEFQPENLRARRGDGSGQRPGTFLAAGRQAQQNYNRNFALNMRAKLGVLIQNHIAFGKRPEQSTGRLLKVSIAPGNSAASNNFVGVGNPEYLDKSQARYWRTFEYGSLAVWRHAFVGTQLYPVKFGVNKWGGLSNLRTASGDSEDHPIGLDKFVVKHEIAPANLYRQLAEQEHNQIVGFSASWAARYINKHISIPDLLAGKDFTPPDVD